MRAQDLMLHHVTNRNKAIYALQAISYQQAAISPCSFWLIRNKGLNLLFLTEYGGIVW